MSEGSARQPRVRRFRGVGDAIAEFKTDGRGFVLVSEELLETLLLEIGYVADGEVDA